MMGQEIKEPALHPAPNLGLFLSQGSVLLALGPGASSLSNKFQTDSAFVTFPSPHSTTDALAGATSPPRG